MDFFEAQIQSQKRTGRLIVLFGFAVIGTVLSGYGAALLIQGALRLYGTLNYHDGRAFGPIWQGVIFFNVTLVTISLIGIPAVVKWTSFSTGGSAVAKLLGGRQVKRRTKSLSERQLLNVVEEMAIASGSPVPATFILPADKSINAFAAGLTTSDAVVAVTRGALDSLTRDELQALVGHEFSHILNGDMRLNLRLASIVFGILFLGQLGDGMFRGLGRIRIRSSRSSRGGKKGGLGGIIIIYLGIAAAAVIIGYVGHFFGRLIQAAVSRQREFLADASAVQFTRNPEGMTGVLKKIGGQSRSPKLESTKAGQINHCFFSQAFVSGFGRFATHPPLKKRIRAIDPHFDGKFTSPNPRRDLRHVEIRKDARAAKPFPDLLMHSIAHVLEPAALLATVGVLDTEGIDHAQRLLTELGNDLREAAGSSEQAEPLLYALLLDKSPAVRAKQLNFLTPETASIAATFYDKLYTKPIEIRLPLAQLTLVGLRGLAAAGQAHLKLKMKQLSECDEHVDLFEFALRRVISHGLESADSPAANTGNWIYSFGAVGGATSVLLSALAHSGAKDETEAAEAFESSRRQIPMMKSVVLQFEKNKDIDFQELDQALDQLAKAAPPIKERVVAAACAVIAHNGVADISEIELLRATCASLDVPMPPVPASRAETISK